MFGSHQILRYSSTCVYSRSTRKWGIFQSEVVRCKSSESKAVKKAVSGTKITYDAAKSAQHDIIQDKIEKPIVRNKT